MSPVDVPPVTDGRALTTDRDRRDIARTDVSNDSEHYQAVSRVRRRIRENLGEDVELLHEQHPHLLEELRDVVCDGLERDEPLDRAIDCVSDTLQDLIQVRGRREAQRALDQRDLPDELLDGVEELRDGWAAIEIDWLEAALEHLDAAREVIVDESDRLRAEFKRNEGR